MNYDLKSPEIEMVKETNPTSQREKLEAYNTFEQKEEDNGKEKLDFATKNELLSKSPQPDPAKQKLQHVSFG